MTNHSENESSGNRVDRKLICYIATHRDGRAYVGTTAGALARRRALHISDAKTNPKTRFHQAIHDDGVNAFAWRELARGDETPMRALEGPTDLRMGAIRRGKGLQYAWRT